MKVDKSCGHRDGGDGAVMKERDLQILALADAREVMDQGLEAAASALEELGGRELSQREAGMRNHLEAFVRSGHRKQTLEELGVSREVYESSEFTEFDRKFREDVPVEEVYGIYAAAHPECKVHTLGTMKSRADTVIIPLCDYLETGEESRINTPGKLSENNWSWRLKREELSEELKEKIKRLSKR